MIGDYKSEIRCFQVTQLLHLLPNSQTVNMTRSFIFRKTGSCHLSKCYDVSSDVCGLSSIVGLHYPALTNIIAKRIPIKDRTFLTSTIFSGGPVG